MAWLFDWLPCYPARSFPPSLPLAHPSPFSSMCVEYRRGRRLAAPAAPPRPPPSVRRQQCYVRSPGPVPSAPRTVAPTTGRGRPRPSSRPTATVSPSVWLPCDQRSGAVVLSRQPHSVAFRWPASKPPSLLPPSMPPYNTAQVFLGSLLIELKFLEGFTFSFVGRFNCVLNVVPSHYDKEILSD